jgi:hypothetical protein
MRFNPHAFKRQATTETKETAESATTEAVDALPVQSDIGCTASSFINLYGRPNANRVTIPEGCMAVTLCLKFNDTAAQVDHFDYHAPLGCPDFLVLLVKKQPQSECLARKALALCPELQNLDWQWKSERYAGGHGNYLASSYFPTPGELKEHITARKTFGDGGPDAVSWEIEFAAPWRGDTLQLWPHKHYGERPPTDTPAAMRDGPSSAPITAAWRLNQPLNGVEIHFTRRPDDASLAPLRADRVWRYSGHSKCWYARQTAETIAFAKSFCERFGGQPIAPVEPPKLESIPARPERKLIRFTLQPCVADLMRPKLPA